MSFNSKKIILYFERCDTEGLTGLMYKTLLRIKYGFQNEIVFKGYQIISIPTKLLTLYFLKQKLKQFDFEIKYLVSSKKK